MTWDLSSYFPRFDAPETRRFKEELAAGIASLRSEAAALAPLSRETLPSWEKLLLQHEELLRRVSHWSSYVSCLAASDAANEEYLAEEADLSRLRAETTKLRVELLRAVKRASEADFGLLLAAPSFHDARNYLDRLRQEARRTMEPEKERLAADLGVDGIQAWGRLYDTVSSKLEFSMVFPDGTRETLPIAQRRSLMEHPDRRVRKAAFEGGNEAWRRVEDVTAAALNAIAGTRLTLNRHRGVEDFLEIALFQAAMSRKTLDALLEALFARLEVPRRILRLKARRMRDRGVAWYDLAAPLETDAAAGIPWEQAKAMVEEAFGRTYPALAEFFRGLNDKRWIDWEPRRAKRPGGFCTGSMLTGESRIFMTYKESLGDVLTLAHESGHAFHGHLLRDVRPYARIYPMTLAETASTFAELLLIGGLRKRPPTDDRRHAAMLDAEIGEAAVYLLDIPVRFEFEKTLYAERKNGPLTVSRLKELMVEAQRRILGDILLPGGEDPYFWASKLHFYITGLTFYNFPYTFGFLLSRALYAMFEREGADFLPRYEEFLRLAGSDTAENVVRRTIGGDPESPDFWTEAISSLEKPLSELESLYGGSTREG
ncbi:MAG TPA: M3 family oligoendopeptidase [candidate division Zixibacteria bacterium]|nr:M3 family oligoendopeptidase [candidate division Zixibacteria bacterium]